MFSDRAHASTEGVTHYLKPSVAGYLIEKELNYLQNAVDNPLRPLLGARSDSEEAEEARVGRGLQAFEVSSKDSHFERRKGMSSKTASPGSHRLCGSLKTSFLIET